MKRWHAWLALPPQGGRSSRHRRAMSDCADTAERVRDGAIAAFGRFGELRNSFAIISSFFRVRMELARDSRLRFFVNGEEVDASTEEPDMLLLDYLRLRMRLTGAKLGCGEVSSARARVPRAARARGALAARGWAYSLLFRNWPPQGGCGACTVVMSSRPNGPHASWHAPHRAINACLTPIAALAGAAITTVEGVGDLRMGLHPIVRRSRRPRACGMATRQSPWGRPLPAQQTRIATMHGSQCGFCTPGFVMSMFVPIAGSRGRPASVTAPDPQLRQGPGERGCHGPGHRGLPGRQPVSVRASLALRVCRPRADRPHRST